MGSSKPTTYTQALLDIQDCLRQIASQIETRPPGDGIQVALTSLVKQQDEMLRLLKEMNGRVRKHGETLAQHNQWMQDHVAATHTALQRDVELTMKRTNTVAVVDTALAFIAGILGLSKFAR